MMQPPASSSLQLARSSRSTAFLRNCRHLLLIGLPLVAALTARSQPSALPTTPSQVPAAEDLQLIRAQHFSDPGEFAHYRGAGNSEQALENRRHSFIAKYNPVSLLLKGSLFAYQKIVS